MKYPDEGGRRRWRETSGNRSAGVRNSVYGLSDRPHREPCIVVSWDALGLNPPKREDVPTQGTRVYWSGSSVAWTIVSGVPSYLLGDWRIHIRCVANYQTARLRDIHPVPDTNEITIRTTATVDEVRKQLLGLDDVEVVS